MAWNRGSLLWFSGLLLGLSLSAAGQPVTLSFENAEEGRLPAGWEAGPPDTPAKWAVTSEDQTHRKILAARSDAGNNTSLCFSPVRDFRDGEIIARIHADGDQQDQGGGIFWRAQDSRNFYYVLYDARRRDLRFFVVRNGSSQAIISAGVAPRISGWFELKVSQAGSQIQAYVDNTLLLESNDLTFTGPGSAGFIIQSAPAAFQFLRVRKGLDLDPLLGPLPTPAKAPTRVL